MTRKEKARNLFLNGANCSQAVIAAFSDITGLDEESSLLISSSFGGGMGHLGEVCGALSGAFMVVGLMFGYGKNCSAEEKNSHYALIREMGEAFKKEYGTYLCRDLLKGLGEKKYPLPQKENIENYKARPCLIFVEKAVDILEEIISSK